MKLEDFGDEDIFEIDASRLSNPEKATLYFERAKIVVDHALRHPDERRHAVRGVKFNRNYLCSKVGCGAAVTTQNPRIVKLLEDTDRRLSQEAGQHESSRRLPGQQTADEKVLREQLNAANRQVELAVAEIADLRRKLRECGYRDIVLTDHGVLPW